MTEAAGNPPKPEEAAAYIEQATTALRDLAARSGMPFLAYLLDMARLEAAARVLFPPRRPSGGDGEPDVDRAGGSTH